ncbi:hypothetical protein JB92DRAFT_2826544 [Gautieria morchelliformis]|nr:hypothetical protein JB92DRAFT_2826544 [Gautieria morchelliformis]
MHQTIRAPKTWILWRYDTTDAAASPISKWETAVRSATPMRQHPCCMHAGMAPQTRSRRTGRRAVVPGRIACTRYLPQFLPNALGSGEVIVPPETQHTPVSPSRSEYRLDEYDDARDAAIEETLRRIDGRETCPPVIFAVESTILSRGYTGFPTSIAESD